MSKKYTINIVINKFKNYKSSEISDYMHKVKVYVETNPDEIKSFDFAKDSNEF